MLSNPPIAFSQPADGASSSGVARALPSPAEQLVQLQALLRALGAPDAAAAAAAAPSASPAGFPPTTSPASAAAPGASPSSYPIVMQHPHHRRHPAESPSDPLSPERLQSIAASVAALNMFGAQSGISAPSSSQQHDYASAAPGSSFRYGLCISEPQSAADLQQQQQLIGRATSVISTGSGVSSASGFVTSGSTSQQMHHHQQHSKLQRAASNLGGTGSGMVPTDSVATFAATGTTTAPPPAGLSGVVGSPTLNATAFGGLTTLSNTALAGLFQGGGALASGNNQLLPLPPSSFPDGGSSNAAVSNDGATMGGAQGGDAGGASSSIPSVGLNAQQATQLRREVARLTSERAQASLDIQASEKAVRKARAALIEALLEHEARLRAAVQEQELGERAVTQQWHRDARRTRLEFAELRRQMARAAVNLGAAGGGGGVSNANMSSTFGASPKRTRQPASATSTAAPGDLPAIHVTSTASTDGGATAAGPAGGPTGGVPPRATTGGAVRPLFLDELQQKQQQEKLQQQQQDQKQLGRSGESAGADSDIDGDHSDGAASALDQTTTTTTNASGVGSPIGGRTLRQPSASADATGAPAKGSPDWYRSMLRGGKGRKKVHRAAVQNAEDVLRDMASEAAATATKLNQNPNVFGDEITNRGHNAWYVAACLSFAMNHLVDVARRQPTKLEMDSVDRTGAVKSRGRSNTTTGGRNGSRRAGSEDEWDMAGGVSAGAASDGGGLQKQKRRAPTEVIGTAVSSIVKGVGAVASGAATTVSTGVGAVASKTRNIVRTVVGSGKGDPDPIGGQFRRDTYYIHLRNNGLHVSVSEPTTQLGDFARADGNDDPLLPPQYSRFVRRDPLGLGVGVMGTDAPAPPTASSAAAPTSGAGDSAAPSGGASSVTSPAGPTQLSLGAAGATAGAAAAPPSSVTSQPVATSSAATDSANAAAAAAAGSTATALPGQATAGDTDLDRVVRGDEVRMTILAPDTFTDIWQHLNIPITEFMEAASFLSRFDKPAAAKDGEDGDDGTTEDDGGAEGARDDGDGVSPQPQRPSRRSANAKRDGKTAAGSAAWTPWRAAMSPGKSESAFFFMGNLVAKSLKEHEYKHFVDAMLVDYEDHVHANPYTLLPKFVGLVSITFLAKGSSASATMRLVLMDNVFRTSGLVTRIFDLKGSTVGRDGINKATGTATKRTQYGAVMLKDNDLPEKLLLIGGIRRKLLLAQLKADVDFLQAHNIIDYSLLVGIRQRHRIVTDADVLTGGGSGGSGGTGGGGCADAGLPSAIAVPTSDTGDGRGYNPLLPEENDLRCLHRFDGAMASLAIHDSDDGRSSREELYYVGLIDVLQQYNLSKKLETVTKGLFFDAQGISVIPPDEFAPRLLALIERITV